MAIRPLESTTAALARPMADLSPWETAQLSNERTLSYWAHPARRGPIYATPDSSAHRVGSTRLFTEDGFPEVYLLLRQFADSTGRQWVEMRIPGRPNGATGWVSPDVLGAFHQTRWAVVVDRKRLRITAYYGGKRRWSAPVGVGKRSTPTPPGRFWIREVFKIRDRNSGYYPYAFGTADYSTLSDWPGGGVVGIHGPYYQPQLIPGRPSHGCIRVRVGAGRWLARHIGVGVPLRVT